MEKLAPEIQKEHQLKHVDVQDKSAPVIESDVHIKKVDREPFLNEVAKGAELKHVDIAHDKSAPIIEPDVHLKTIDREGLLKEIESMGQKSWRSKGQIGYPFFVLLQ